MRERAWGRKSERAGERQKEIERAKNCGKTNDREKKKPMKKKREKRSPMSHCQISPLPNIICYSCYSLLQSFAQAPKETRE